MRQLKHIQQKPYIPTQAEIEKVNDWFVKAEKAWRMVAYLKNRASIENQRLVTALIYDGYLTYSVQTGTGAWILKRTDKFLSLLVRHEP